MIADEYIVIGIKLGQLLKTYVAAWAVAAPCAGILLKQCALLGKGVHSHNRNSGSSGGILICNGIHLVNIESHLVVTLLGNGWEVQTNCCRLAVEGINSGIEVLRTRLSCEAIGNVERLNTVGTVVGNCYGNGEFLTR